MEELTIGLSVDTQLFIAASQLPSLTSLEVNKTSPLWGWTSHTQSLRSAFPQLQRVQLWDLWEEEDVGEERPAVAMPGLLFFLSAMVTHLLHCLHLLSVQLLGLDTACIDQLPRLRQLRVGPVHRL